MSAVHRLFVATFLCLGLSACTTATGTRVRLNEASLSNIKTLGVLIKTNQDFSVRLSRDRMTGTGAVIGGLIGAGIEAGVRTSNDEHLQKRLRPLIGEFEVQAALQTDLQKHLGAANIFSAVQPVANERQRALSASGIDGVLEVTVTQWGLVVCR